SPARGFEKTKPIKAEVETVLPDSRIERNVAVMTERDEFSILFIPHAREMQYKGRLLFAQGQRLRRVQNDIMVFSRWVSSASLRVVLIKG
ncbi:MAG: hypothetical protein PVJ86_10035, partial [Phycisphaerales bacterium]